MMLFWMERMSDDPLFSTYTDDKDNWPEIPDRKELKIPEPMVLVKPPVEPVAPSNEIKLEVQKTGATEEGTQSRSAVYRRRTNRYG